IDQAEDPEKLLKQVILDMENQLLQVKTQVAIAIADEHVLERKRKEYEERVAEWTRRAELAVDKKQDDLARAALERSLSYRRMAAGCEQQVEDQVAQVEHLKTALRQLEQKLAEARARSEVLIAQHRRAPPWIWRTNAVHTNNLPSNPLYHGHHARGQTGLSFAFALPTQCGDGSDDALDLPEIGKVGVHINTLDGFEVLFDAIPIEQI